jgi:hypothetical protein
MSNDTTQKKTYRVKPKERHRQVIKNMAENGGNKRQAILDAGYSQEVADNPKKVTESKGFLMALEESGLTKEFLNNALYDDIKNKPKNRKAELELAYRLRGDLTERKEGNKTLILITSGESAKRYNVQ